MGDGHMRRGLLGVLVVCGLAGLRFKCDWPHRDLDPGAQPGSSTSPQSNPLASTTPAPPTTTSFRPTIGSVSPSGDVTDGLYTAIDAGLPPVLRGTVEGHDWAVYVYQVRQGATVFECDALQIGAIQGTRHGAVAGRRTGRPEGRPAGQPIRRAPRCHRMAPLGPPCLPPGSST